MFSVSESFKSVGMEFHECENSVIKSVLDLDTMRFCTLCLGLATEVNIIVDSTLSTPLIIFKVSHFHFFIDPTYQSNHKVYGSALYFFKSKNMKKLLSDVLLRNGF